MVVPIEVVPVVLVQERPQLLDQLGRGPVRRDTLDGVVPPDPQVVGRRRVDPAC